MSYDPANNCSWDKTLMRSDRGKGEKEEVFPSDNSRNYNSREVVGSNCSKYYFSPPPPLSRPLFSLFARTEADVTIKILTLADEQ